MVKKKNIRKVLPAASVSITDTCVAFDNENEMLVAEEAGFEVFLTPDKNIRYQQNLAGRKIAVVVVGNPQWPVLRLHVERLVTAVNAAKPGSYTEVDIPG